MFKRRFQGQNIYQIIRIKFTKYKYDSYIFYNKKKPSYIPRNSREFVYEFVGIKFKVYTHIEKLKLNINRIIKFLTLQRGDSNLKQIRMKLRESNL